MKRILCTILLYIGLVLSANAQSYIYPVDNDYDIHKFIGTVVLINGDSLHGNIKYNNTNDFIIVNPIINDSVFESKIVFHYSKIDYLYRFKAYDIIDHNYYVILKLNKINDYNLFKVISYGKTLFVRSEKLHEFKEHQAKTFKTIKYNYYYVNDNNKLIKIDKIKKELYKIMKDDWSSIETYMKFMNIKFKDIENDDHILISLFRYYNFL